VGTDRAADVARLRRHLAAEPDDAVAWHNLASAEGDLGHAMEAERAARKAIALGIAAPETRFVLARSLHEQGRLDEAEAQFLESLRMRPSYAQAHRDLAQLRWMRSGDASAALSALDSALAAAPRDPALNLVRSIVLEFVGDLPGAAASVDAGLAASPTGVELLLQAAHLRAELGDAAGAVACARRASALAPDEASVGIILCEALLASGQAMEAAEVSAGLREAHPLDQHAIALQATAWRLLGDPRYVDLHDYGGLVVEERLQPPAGRSLQDFLGEVARDLTGLHRFGAHPFQQSVRGGGQLPIHAAEMERPVLRAFFDAISVAVRKRLAALGRGPDPFRSRNSGRFIITGAWSIRLASGGFHTDHVHPKGWLSGVCYVDIPPEIPESGEGRAGWLRLGQPGIRTQPALPPEHYVEPKPGSLILFPAYMWHGVERFEAATPRLTVAFDALPA
jgi:predicted Zn-dependent protease